jgi:hypothetical protein
MGNRPTTCHCEKELTVRKCGFGTVRLSGIDIGNGQRLGIYAHFAEHIVKEK